MAWAAVGATMTTAAEGAPAPGLVALWHAAGRAAVDPKKRLLALQGVLASGPALLLGGGLAGLLTLEAREATLARPLAWLLEPVRAAWLGDRDGALLLAAGLPLLCLSLVWGFFGGALSRMAAVDLAGRGRERGTLALGFARRRLLALWGAPLLWAGALVVPLLLAWLALLLARLPGVAGSALLAPAIVAVAALALLAVVGTSLVLACACLARPAVAADDADLFDAITRSVTYAWGGLPRLVGVRLWFLSGVLLGSGWRLLRTLLAGALGLWVLERGLGGERLQDLLGVLASGEGLVQAARARPWGDVAGALALGLSGATLAALWLADLASRLACARVAAYLVLRRAVDRVEVARLATPPGDSGTQSAHEAGFEEVGRVGAP